MWRFEDTQNWHHCHSFYEPEPPSDKALNPSIGLTYFNQVYDRDSVRDVLKDHDFIGSCCNFSLGSLLDAKQKKLELEIVRPSEKKSGGTLIVHADAVMVPTPNNPVQLQVALQSSEGMKYYFQITKLLVCGTYFPVYRSELLERTTCYFKPVTLKLSILSAGNPDRNVRLEIFEYHSMGRSKAMGYSGFNFGDVQRAPAESQLPWKKAKGNIDFSISLSTSTTQNKGIGMKVTLKDTKRSRMARS